MAKFSLKKYISPVFVILLFVSFVMWYLTKLGYTYTAEVPITVDVAGNRFTVVCVVEGPGYRILAHRMFRQGEVRLGFNEVQTTPSVINQGKYVINPYSLQNAISLRNNDIRIISVGDIPEITMKGR